MARLGRNMWAGWDHEANEGSREEKECQAEPQDVTVHKREIKGDPTKKTQEWAGR